MAKIINMFFILIALQATLLIYQGQYEVNSSSFQSEENNALWAAITGLENFSGIEWFWTLVGVAGFLTIAGIIAAGAFGYKTDFIILAPLVGGLISIGIVMRNLAIVMANELGKVFTTCDQSRSLFTCQPITITIALTVGTLTLYYVWTVIEWWRGRDYSS